MSLQNALRKYVATAAPTTTSRAQEELVERLLTSRAFYLTGDGLLSVRAESAATGAIGTSTLATRIPLSASGVLAELRILADAGLIDPKLLRDQDPGVRVETF